ncbi:MAG: hypothetical protein VKP62_13430 [Candidatus Sericytochromatia bacterium]|nr:hypothetical protein [Candidatus Sericytochromatia bacterium]
MNFGNLFSFAPAGDETAQATRQIKRWAERLFGAGLRDVVTVSELRCGEIDCPDLETLVVLSPASGGRRFLKIAKPATAVTETDLVSAFRAGLQQEIQP